MKEAESPRRILALADDSPAAAAAVQAATRIAAALAEQLSILAVSHSSSSEAGTSIEAALAAAYQSARERVSSVEAIRATGEVLDVAGRRLAESPSALVVMGARWRAGQGARRLSPSVWRVVQALEPPILVTPAGEFDPAKALFCTGGERFIEPGAQFAARILAALGSSVTVVHVLPDLPGMYGDRLRDEESQPEEFLASNSRSSRNVQRQIEIFRSAGVETRLALATGDVATRVVEQVRRGGHGLLIVGSSPERGALRTYMLGDLTRDIVGRAVRPFLVVRSKPPGLLTELWRSLKEGAAEGGRPAENKGSDPGV